MALVGNWRRFLCAVILTTLGLLGASPSHARAHAASDWPIGLSSTAERVDAVRTFAEGLSRNDAEAIDAGWQGRRGWREATRRAVREALTAPDPLAFGLVLRRLYASYPSLHSRVVLRQDIDLRAIYGAPYLPFTLKVDRVGPGITPGRVFVADVLATPDQAGSTLPAAGDEVTAINDQPIERWLSRLVSVCRRNAKWQCYDDFDAQLRGELLGWDRRQPMRLSLMRAGTHRTANYVSIPNPSFSDQRVRTGCGTDKNDYQGFHSVYTGWNLCVFQQDSDPSVELWRLKSFRYPKDGTIGSVEAEVDRVWSQHWIDAAKTVKKLIIDVSSNGGGSAPMPWYSLLFDKPYQEQYARYLRLPAFDDPDLLAEAMSDESHDRWISRIKIQRPQLWSNSYTYLPPVPQFCAPVDTLCDGLEFSPKPNGFTGRVAIILDNNCVSSCSGFTWNVLRVLGSRAAAFGMPDSGDSNYARMPLELAFTTGRWTTRVASQTPDNKVPPLLTANVMVTRSTDAQGRSISGRSSKTSVNVARIWSDADGEWQNRVLNAAMSAH